MNRSGYVLLQHRDENAPVFPGKWTMISGAIESGEAPEAAARRELVEETGLTVVGPLVFIESRLTPRSDPRFGLAEWFLFCALTDAKQSDVVCGEGRAMIFTPPRLALSLSLTPPAARFLPGFLSSRHFRRLQENR